MIYLVSGNKSLFETDRYEEISIDSALEKLEQLKYVQLDTETEGLNFNSKKLLTVQLGCTDFQIVFDWSTFSASDKTKLKEYLESNRTFIGHNLMFDLTFLYKNNIWPKDIYDTMIAEQLIYLGFPKTLSNELMFTFSKPLDGYEQDGNNWELSYSLKATAKRRIGIDIDKTVRGKIVNVGLTTEVIEYAAGDVMWLELIRDKQLERLEQEDLLKACEFECKFIKALAYERFCGIKLDPVKWSAKMKSDREKLEQAIKELNDYVVELDKQGFIYRYAFDKNELKRIKELKFQPYIPMELCGEYLNEAQDLQLKIIRKQTGRTFEEVKNGLYRFNIRGLFAKVNLQGDLFGGFDTEPKCTINWSSSAQVIKLFELLGIQTHTFDKKTKKEKKSVEEKLIAPQADKFPIIPIFLRYQEAAKVVSTYGQNWLDAIDPISGRVHAELHSVGTDTSRISSGGGIYKVNILNLPKDAITRGCFVAEKGNSWISIDYAGQESAITASVSGDERMCEILNTGGDMHSTVAKLCWPEAIGDTPIEEIKDKFKHIRQEAKGVEFGIFYGGDFNTLHANKGIPIDKAKEIYNSFMAGFPGIKQYQDYCRKEVMRKGYIMLNPLTKHRAHIFDFEFLSNMESKFDKDFWDYYREMKIESPSCETVQNVRKYFKRKSESERQSINYRIQNRGAMCFKTAMIMFFNWIVKNNYLNTIKICVTPYDEINVEAPTEIAEHVAEILTKCMIDGGKPFCPKVYLGADVSRKDDGSLPNYWIH